MKLLTGGKDIKAPNYTLRNKKTKEKFIINCTYTELQDKLANDSNLIQMLVMQAIIGGVGNTHSNSKTSDGWKDHLKRIKKGSGKNNTIKV